MIWYDALAEMHAIQGWMRLPLDKNGRPYGPGYFRKRNWHDYLKWRNRKVAYRLQAWRWCVACGEPIPEASTGDHLIPISQGGPDDATNYAPLCPRCNVSKGRRDFWDWWLRKGLRVDQVDRTVMADLLCAYARLRYAQLSEAGLLYTKAPDYILQILRQCREAFVPRSHWPALDELRYRTPAPQLSLGF